MLGRVRGLREVSTYRGIKKKKQGLKKQPWQSREPHRHFYLSSKCHLAPWRDGCSFLK